MDSRPEVVMVRHDSTVGEAWITAITASLNDQAAKQAHDAKSSESETSKQWYETLVAKQLAGMWISVFARSPLVEDGYMTEIMAASEMTGWAGFAANKGACAVRLK